MVLNKENKEAIKFTPGGTHSIARQRLFSEIKRRPPIFIKWAQGSHFCDNQGNIYLDYNNAFGAILLGYAHPAFNKAIQDQLEKGSMYGLNHDQEIELCKKIVQYVPCAETVRLCTTGSEAATAAFGIARRYLGKNKFIKFIGHYHGWHDHFLPGSSAHPDTMHWPPRGIPINAWLETISIPWNDLNLIEQVLKRGSSEIAAIITEPIMFNGPYSVFPDNGYLEELINLAHSYNVLVIFDEIICGFRLAMGGAQEILKINPDLAIFGKALGNGVPISVIAGKREIMECGKFIGGTYNSNPISTTAALATIEQLEKKNVYKTLYQLSRKLMNGLKEIIEDLDIPAVVQGPGPAFSVYFTEEGEIKGEQYFQKYLYTKTGKNQLRQEIFFEELWKKNILFRPRICMTLSHTEKDIEKTLEAAKEAFKKTKI